MAIALNLTAIDLNNHNLIRDEVNRLRTKLGLAAYSWTALAGGLVSAYDWNNTRDGMTSLSGSSSYVGTLDLSGIPSKTALTDPVTTAEYNGAINLLALVDSKCVDNANYSNYSYCPYCPNYQPNYTVWNDIGVLSNGGFAPNYTLN